MLIVTVQTPVPLQAPVQPVNLYPVLGVALRITDVPELNEALQVLPQLMPEGLDVMVPLAGLGTLSRYVSGAAVEKLADTLWFEFIATTQAPVPEQAPDQPENV